MKHPRPLACSPVVAETGKSLGSDEVERTQLIKRISLVRRKEGMSRDAFIAHWMGAHADIVRQLPGLRGLRLGVVHRWSPEDLAWDGVGELWFDSIALAEQALSTEPYRSQLIEDRNEFVGELQYCIVEEHTVVKPP
jgi:uncharacterized protein (TIGR02118 family)